MGTLVSRSAHNIHSHLLLRDPSGGGGGGPLPPFAVVYPAFPLGRVSPADISALTPACHSGTLVAGNTVLWWPGSRNDSLHGAPCFIKRLKVPS